MARLARLSSLFVPFLSSFVPFVSPFSRAVVKCDCPAPHAGEEDVS
jgi:hypothetical protein